MNGGETRTASCNDEVLTAGGSTPSGNSGRVLNFSRPAGSSWEAKGSPTSGEPSITQAYAQCQQLIPE